MYTLKHVSGPAVEPVSLAEVKSHLRLDPSDTSEDVYLYQLIRAARKDTENILDRKLRNQTWDILADTWPSYRYWSLPISPIQSLVSITYNGEDGTPYTLDPSWIIQGAGTLLLRATRMWPYETAMLEFGAITIRVVAGMLPESDGLSPETFYWPANIVQAILYRIGTFYATREDVTIGTTQIGAEIPGTMRHLLSSERRLGA